MIILSLTCTWGCKLPGDWLVRESTGTLYPLLCSHKSIVLIIGAIQLIISLNVFHEHTLHLSYL